MITTIEGTDRHDARCPHCNNVLLHTNAQFQELFPGVSSQIRDQLEEDHAFHMYLDGERIPLLTSLKKISLQHYDQGLLLGVCPWCHEHYYTIWVTVVSRVVEDAFEDEFDEDKLLLHGGTKLFCKVEVANSEGSQLPGHWLLERLEQVHHPYDMDGNRVRIDRHWIGPIATLEPKLTPMGIVPPKDISAGDELWRNSAKILSELLPTILDECRAFKAH